MFLVLKAEDWRTKWVLDLRDHNLIFEAFWGKKGTLYVVEGRGNMDLNNERRGVEFGGIHIAKKRMRA